MGELEFSILRKDHAILLAWNWAIVFLLVVLGIMLYMRTK